MTIVAPVEGDGIAIAVASQHLLENNIVGTAAAYRPSFQPGTYALVELASKVTGLDTYTFFSLTSALCCLIFIYISSSFVSALTQYPIPVCGILLLLLLPQIYSEGNYPNSTVLAAAGGSLAFLVLVNPKILGFDRLLLAGFFIGAGAFFRFDFALMGFSTLPLLLRRQESCKAIISFIIIGLAGGVVAIGLMLLFGANPLDLLSTSRAHLNSSGSWITILRLNALTLAEFFPISTAVLLLIGVFAVCRRGQAVELSLILVGFLPLWLAYSMALTTPKYLYYALPFLLFGCITGLKYLFELAASGGNKILGALTLVLVLQLLIGVNFELREKPWRLERSPKLLPIAEFSFASGLLSELSFHIGVGSAWPSHDGPSYPFGTFWGPLAWYHEKAASKKSLGELVRFAQSAEGAKLPYASTSWVGSRSQMLGLTLAGYRLRSYTDTPQIWQNGKETIMHYTDENYSFTADRLLMGIRQQTSPSDFILFTGLPREAYLVNSLGRQKERFYLPDPINGRFALFRLHSDIAPEIIF